MSTMFGWQFSCTNTTCLPFTTVIKSNIRQCQTSCLAQVQCGAASFHRLTNYCELFADMSNQNNNMAINAHTATMIVQTGTRFPASEYEYQNISRQN